MSEPVFQRHTRGLTLAEIAALTGAATAGRRRGALASVNIAPLDRAAPADLSFLRQQARFADAGRPDPRRRLPDHRGAGAALAGRVVALVVPEPFRAFVMVARELFPHALRPSSLCRAAMWRAPMCILPRVWKTASPGARRGRRAGRRDRRRHRDRRQRRGRCRGSDRPRLRDWRRHRDQQCPDRRSGHRSSRLPDRSGWLRLCDGRRRPV